MVRCSGRGDAVDGHIQVLNDLATQTKSTMGFTHTHARTHLHACGCTLRISIADVVSVNSDDP